MEKNMRNQVEQTVQAQLNNIFKRVTEIKSSITGEPSQYTNNTGKTYRECCGAYNDYLSRAMASDMFHYQMLFANKYPDLFVMLKNWSTDMAKYNYRLLRMMDDQAGDRPMEKWDYKETYELIDKICHAAAEAKTLHEKTPDDMLADFKEKCKIWATRLVYMNTWAFSLESMDNNEQMLLESQTEAYDNDGNKISGLGENEKAFMKSLCTIRTQLIKMVVKIPVYSDEHQELMDILVRFETMGRIILKSY